MATTTYQVSALIKSNNPTVVVEAVQVLSSAIQNAIAYGLILQDVSLDGSGRLRFRLSDPFPAAEVESFQGAIIQV